MAMNKLHDVAKNSVFFKILFGGFIFLAIGGLVFTDITGNLRGGIGKTVVAHVGDETIDLRRFDGELQNALRPMNMTPQEAYKAGLVNIFLQGQINGILQMQMAERLNLSLDNKAIAGQVAKMFGDMPTDKIKDILRSQGMNEQALGNAVRADVMKRTVQMMPLPVSSYVPSYLIAASHKINSERRSGVIYTLPLTQFEDGMQISDTDLQDYYKSHIGLYTVPEERQFTIGTMTIDMAAENLPDITEADIRSEYDSHPSNFTVPETRVIAQAVVDDPDQAQAIYETALKSGDLHSAVKTISDIDPAKVWRVPADYTRAGMPKELADAAFADNIQKGNVTPPVKTPLGYSVMVVTDIKKEYVKPFDAVKDTLKKEMQAARNYDALYNKMQETEELIDGGQPYAKIAEQTKLKTQDTGFLGEEAVTSVEGPLLDILKVSPAMIDEIYKIQEGSATYPLEIDEKHYVVVGVKSVKPQAVLPFDDVKADIRKAVEAEKLQSLAESRVGAIIKSLNTGTTKVDSESLLKQAEQKPFKDAKRSDEKKLMASIFQTAKGQYVYEIDGETVQIFVVHDISHDKTPETTKENDEQIAGLRRTQAAIIDSLLGQYLRDETDIRINESLLKQSYSAAPAQ